LHSELLAVSTASPAPPAVDAASAVREAEQARNVVVLDPVQALPLSEPLLELAGSARAVLTVEDGAAERGIGAALTVGLAQRATVTSPAPVARTLGVSQPYIPPA